MQESWSFHAAQTSMQKALLPSNTCAFLFLITGKEFADQELGSPSPMLSSVLDNQKQAVTVASDVTTVGWGSPASRRVETAGRFLIFLDWQKLSMPSWWRM